MVISNPIFDSAQLAQSMSLLDKKINNKMSYIKRRVRSPSITFKEDFNDEVEYEEIIVPAKDSFILTKIVAYIVSLVRSFLYSIFFAERNAVSTQHGYFSILRKIESDSQILDVGCGDGIYFTNKAVINLIKEKRIKITAIDVDVGAVQICKKRIKKNGLQDYVFAQAVSVECIQDRCFDYVLWMESYPVIDMALFETIFTHSLKLCKKKCYLYHNLLKQPSLSMTLFKPLIYYFTSVDFGRATTLGEMRIIMNGITDYPFEIKPLISCKSYEMLSTKLKSLATYIPLLNKEITQYLIIVSVEQEEESY